MSVDSRKSHNNGIEDKLEDFYSSLDLEHLNHTHGSQNVTFRDVDPSTMDLVRVTLSTIATATYITAVAIAISDLNLRRKTIHHTLSNNFFLMVQVVFVTVSILEVIEFFAVYDFLFFQKANWAAYHQWVAFYIDYTRHVQLNLILAAGVHQTLAVSSASSWCLDFGPVGSILLAVNFFGMALLLPTVALIDGILNERLSLDSILFSTLVPFTASTIIGGFLFMTARRRVLKLIPHEILATKVIVLFQILVIVQALESCIVDLMLRYFSQNQWHFVNTTEDLFRPLYPITYLLMYKCKFSAKLFTSLHQHNGAQRLTSIDPFDGSAFMGGDLGGHEMQETGNIALAFPSNVFSLTSDDESSEQMNKSLAANANVTSQEEEEEDSDGRQLLK